MFIGRRPAFVIEIKTLEYSPVRSCILAVDDAKILARSLRATQHAMPKLHDETSKANIDISMALGIGL